MLNVDLLLATGATYRKYNKNDIIFKEDADAIFYYQLVNGRIKLVNIHDNGREYIQDFVESGESFGEIALLQNENHLVTAIAEDDCLVLKLQKNDFLLLMSQNPDQSQSLMNLLAARLKFKTLLIKELYNYSPTTRIKSFINYVKGQNKFICPVTKRLLLTRQQIADMTGLRVETVIRTIKALQKQSVVSIDEKGKVYC